MLNKVRARHGIELPVEKWKRTPTIALVLGGVAFLFLVFPLVVSAAMGMAFGLTRMVLIGLASGFLVLFGSALFLPGSTLERRAPVARARPGGVTAIAWWLVIQALLVFAAAAIVFGAPALLGGLALPDLGAALVFLGVVVLLLARGLFRMRVWAWVGTNILALAQIVAGIAAIALALLGRLPDAASTGAAYGGALGDVVVGAVIFGYLLSVRDEF